jgi:hypothetical protein
MSSYKTAWTSHVKERLEAKDGYPGIMKWVAEKGGRFSTWHKVGMPASQPEEDLDSVVYIGCVFPNHPYYAIFLAWAKEGADRALSDPRFAVDPEVTRGVVGWKVEGVYPGNHGATLAAACLTRALQGNSELDAASLLLACDEIAESALAGGSKMWDYIAQSEYLRCIRLSLVAGDVEKAQFFLKNIRRKFKHTFAHQAWLQALANAISESGGKALSEAAAQHFQQFFDTVRNPDYKLPSNHPGGINLSANLSLLRLELAAIQQRYLLAQPLAGNWPQVLALISQ